MFVRLLIDSNDFCFGSKEALRIAALRTPEKIPWAAALDAGPDDRPIRQQLAQHCKAMSLYYDRLGEGLAVLNAAGITTGKVLRGRKDPPPVQAFRALTGWLKRAQAQSRITKCDVDTLAITIIRILHNRSFHARLCGTSKSVTVASEDSYLDSFVDLLWNCGMALERVLRSFGLARRSRSTGRARWVTCREVGNGIIVPTRQPSVGCMRTKTVIRRS
jgi:hypothetical protein